MLNYSLPCSCSSNLSSFWLAIKQQWTIKISSPLFSMDTILEGPIQESFQQSLVEIGSVVSEEKIFFKFHPPFFLICIIGQNRQKFKVHKKSCNTC
jgi:UV DNA damage repair endonuclease